MQTRSIASQLTIFRIFWGEMLAEERVLNATILQVKAPVADAPLPRYLSVAEYQRLVQIVLQIVQQETAQHRPQDRFNQAWFYLLAHAGLRLSEVRNLRLEDCDLVEAVILLPENLFYSTTAPGIIMVLNKAKCPNL